jgi:pyrimidine-specific ribonucleoside hydrolase
VISGCRVKPGAQPPFLGSHLKTDCVQRDEGEADLKAIPATLHSGTSDSCWDNEGIKWPNLASLTIWDYFLAFSIPPTVDLHMVKRRQFIVSGLGTIAALNKRLASDPLEIQAERRGGKVPIVHITDLYHPPQDPDDHVDLATVAALKEFDLRGVILDCTRKFLDAAPAGFDIRRDPGYVPVLQLAHILGRPIPVAAGPVSPLTHPSDTAADRPVTEQGGIALLLNILEESDEPVVLSLVGSARVLTAAFNRNPGLVRSRTRRVLLNAGSTSGPKREWNVGLDPAAYIGLWNAGLPIDWYPCATERSAFNPDHERGTYWKTTHAVLFRALSPPLRAWFRYAFTGSTRGDCIRALGEEEDPAIWEKILPETRNLWTTASLIMAAGRVLCKSPAGWRFLPREESEGSELWPLSLEPVVASVNSEAEVQWHPAEGESTARLFRRRRGVEYGEAMGEALGALLASLRT